MHLMLSTLRSARPTLGLLLFLATFNLAAAAQLSAPPTTAKAQPAQCGALLNAELNSDSTQLLSAQYDSIAKKYRFVHLAITVYRSEDFVTTVYHTTQFLRDHPPSTETEIETEMVSDTQAYLEAVLPLVEMANEKFEDRRGWGVASARLTGRNRFSEKNIKVARDYLLQSSYVLVRNHAGDLLGGIRHIQMEDRPGYRLPEEKFLEVNLPQMGLVVTSPGVIPWKNEVGTYVIDETLSADLRRKVELEIWPQLYKINFSKGSVRQNYYDQATHTYGNRASLLMYRRMNFRKLRIYYYKGELKNYANLDEKEIPPIVVKDPETDVPENWWPIVQLPEDAVELNEKFSTATLAGVGPDYLERRRREMAAPYDSIMQMGALFPQLLKDLESNLESHDEGHFLAALTGLAETLEDCMAHMNVAKSAHHRPDIFGRAVAQVIKMRAQLATVFESWDVRLAAMNQSQRQSTALFFNHVLRLDSNSIARSEFLRRGVFVLLSDSDPSVLEYMLSGLNLAYTPKEWLEHTNLVWDLSVPVKNAAGQYVDDPAQFTADTRRVEPKLFRQLEAAGYASAEIEAFAADLESALFDKSTVVGDRQDIYTEIHPGFNRALARLFLLRQPDPTAIEMFIQLAAARRYVRTQL